MFNDQKYLNRNSESQTVIKVKTEDQTKQKSKIVAILKSYESLKEWSDLGQWLLKLQAIFKSYQGTYIPKKKLLCKRLAQCLSPIWNKAIHENTLTLYDLILQILCSDQEYDLIQDLPLFSLGLFPFFGFASIQCKPMFLSILEKYYYPLKKELLPCMGGLINSIIVGMEDTNEEMMKKVMSSLDQACESVGIKQFFGLLWITIIRSVRSRLGVYKYLMKRWTKQQQIEVNENEIKEDDKMPNKSALVINALLASLDDESSLVKRAALDFMSLHCKIQDKIFSQQEQLILIEQALLLFQKQDHAVIRRINNWLIGEEELSEKNPNIFYVQEGLKRILIEEQGDPLKVLQNWYMQHPETVQLTLFQIGYSLAKYIYQKTILLENQNQTEKLAELLKGGERLIESISSQSELIIKSLFEQLNKYMKEQKQDQIKECILIFDFCLNNLMKQQFSDLSKIEDLQLFQQRTECLQEFIIIVIKELMNLTCEQVFESSISQLLLEQTVDCINKIRKRLDMLENDKDLQAILGSNYNKQVEPQKNSILVQLNQIDIDIISQYCNYYIQINEYSIINEQETLFSILSLILLRSQLYLMKQGNYQYNEIPSWIKQLFKSLDQGTNKINLCSIQILIELLKTSSLHQNIKSLTEMITKNSYQDLEPFPQILSLCMDQTSYHNQNCDNQHNYIKQIFEKLWVLLDQNYHDQMIVEFILYITENFQHVFVYVIEQSLKQGDQRRFQIYCRITNTYYKRHPNKNTGVGIIQMLNFLEHENPLIRYNTKTWLSESAPFFFRILDPIMLRLISFQKDIEKKNEFSLDLAVDSIKKLQSLYSSKEWFQPYIEKTKPTFYEDENINTYYKLICLTLIQFIVADFQNNEYTKINAISAELLEIVINNTINEKSKTQILISYFNIILNKFDQVIKSRDQVLQLQLLNLVKVFLLHTYELQKDLTPENKVKLIDIYDQQLFFDNLVIGLKLAKVYYLKQRYLNTIVVGIYSISYLLPPKILNEKIILIITTLLALLKQCEYNSSQIVKSFRRISNVKILKNQKPEFNTNNFQQVNIQQLDNEQLQIKTTLSGDDFEEVMSLSNSIRAIICYFFQFKYDSKEIDQRPNAAGVLVDLFTLNLFFKKTDKQLKLQKQQEQLQFENFPDTCQMLLKLFPQIIQSYLECWRCTLKWDHLFNKGCFIYEYDKFDQFNKQLKDQLCKQEEDYSDEDQIQQSILQLLKPCSTQFTTKLIQSLLLIWQNEYSVNFYADPKININMCKLIEIAITLQISPDDFIAAFINTQQIQGIMSYYQKNKYKKGPYQFNYDQATFENGILFFLYTYFSSVLFQNLKNKELIRLWNGFLSISKPLLQSRHINTICFLLEIIHLMSWKFSPKDVLEEFRKELHTQLRQILVILAEIASMQYQYLTFTSSSLENFNQSQFDQNLQLIVPFTPTIFELYTEYYQLRQKDVEKTEEGWNECFVQRNLFDPYQQKGLKLEQQDFSKKCSIIALKTLKRLSQVTLINTYEVSRGERIVENTKEFMTLIFPLIEDKDNQIIVESASELLHSILKLSKDQLSQLFLNDILNIFNKQEFFKCTGRCLKFWTEIIDIISEKTDLLTEQLGNNSKILQGFTGLFQSKSAEILKKTKGFERVCFIIYSGGVDKYQSKLSSLLDAILTVIKDINQQHEAITILIIFCIRILVLRLSQSSLTQVFRKIWPYLISMLIQIFDRKGKQANPYLLISGLKLIELFSLFQLEEFYFYEWIFVFDYFGITINFQQVEQQQQQQKVKIVTPYKFIPYMAYQFPITAQYNVDYENKLYPDQYQQNLLKKKRLVKIKDVQEVQEFESKLRQQALYLCQHLIDINQQRVEVSPQSLEEIIEAEFISLDDYISRIQ
ncbi:unnamed protein product [Paramecium primaurelia]|uniref:Dopey N-terminal domain-containing protein n=1 Tax=Paramecium primaurelia TaxID=5886 RepID=A0A8S1KCC4_PARPR|nr:unnamed protein product [Paramecium primaurelia]